MSGHTLGVSMYFPVYTEPHLFSFSFSFFFSIIIVIKVTEHEGLSTNLQSFFLFSFPPFLIDTCWEAKNRSN